MILYLQLLLVILLSTPAFATEYFVKNGGSDSLDGLSDLNAWATIAKVEATVTSGDTVYFRSQDTWTKSTGQTLTTAAGVTYDGSTYGTGTRATITSTYTGEPNPNNNYCLVEITVSDVTFRGFEVDANSVRLGGVFIGYPSGDDVSNTTMDNCVIHDNGGIAGDWNYGILVSNRTGTTTSNTIITDTEVYNTWHEGITIYASWSSYDNKVDGVLVDGCHVHDTGTDPGTGTSIAINNSCANVTIENSTLSDNSATGIGIRVSPPWEGPGNVIAGPTSMIVRNNIISGNESTGITIANPRNFPIDGVFYNNLFINNGTTTDDVQGSDFFIASSDVYNFRGSSLEIYSNTFYSIENPVTHTNFRGVLGVGVWGGSMKYDGVVTFKNNIIYAGDYTAIYDYSGHLTHSNNLIYRSSGSGDTAVKSSVFTDLISATSVTVSNEEGYTSFTKSGGTDWTTLITSGNRIRWTGFTEPLLNGSFQINSVSADVIRVTPRISKGYYVEEAVTGMADSAIASTKVVAYTIGSSTHFFNYENTVDWTTLATVGNTVTWSGFSNTNYNGVPLTITGVGSNYIAVALFVDEFTETATVTGEKGVVTSYSGTNLTSWESTTQNTDPSFAGGTLPDGFTDNIPNTDYFSISSGDAIDNGATLGSPYNSSINGTSRPQGTFYDIGAYEWRAQHKNGAQPLLN